MKETKIIKVKNLIIIILAYLAEIIVSILVIKYKPEVSLLIGIPFILIFSLFFIITYLCIPIKKLTIDNNIVFDGFLIRRIVSADVFDDSMIELYRHIFITTKNYKYIIAINKKTIEGLKYLVNKSQRINENYKNKLLNDIEWVKDNMFFYWK